MKYYTTVQLHPWLYTIYDPLGVYCYLIVGKDRALLYDTGHGLSPLDEAIKEVCDLPYDVILSHGHWDHTAGAYQFEKVWLHPGDNELCERHFTKKTRELICSMFENDLGEDISYSFDKDKYLDIDSNTQVELLPLDHGQIFDLGEITVEIVPMEGHTLGSVGALIREHKLLLDGDGANGHCWMFLEDCLKMDVYINMLRRTLELDFDNLIMSHSELIYPKSDFKRYLEVAENIDMAKSTPYDYKFKELGGYLYEESDGFGIVFDPNRL